MESLKKIINKKTCKKQMNNKKKRMSLKSYRTKPNEDKKKKVKNIPNKKKLQLKELGPNLKD
jgi:hypothetical protein